MAITISQLFLYPIKSCRGIPVQSAQITPLGFKHDRAYMLVEIKPAKQDDSDGLEQNKWVPMTLREHPRVNAPCLVEWVGYGVGGMMWLGGRTDALDIDDGRWG